MITELFAHIYFHLYVTRRRVGLGMLHKVRSLKDDVVQSEVAAVVATYR